MKRFFLAITVITVIIGSFTISSVCAEEARVEFQGTVAARGKLADMRVVLSDNTELSSLELLLDYDSSALVMYDIKDTSVLGNSDHGYDGKEGGFSLAWDGRCESGTVAVITFMVKENAEIKKYPVTATSNKATVITGYINVTEDAPGDVTGDEIMDGEDAEALSKSVAGWIDAAIQENAGDVNGDGKVNLLDAIIIARSVNGINGYTINGEKEQIASVTEIELYYESE